MLYITDAQIIRMAKDRFVERMIEFLKEEYPDETRGESPADLRSEIHAQIIKAEDYGFETERDVSVYVLTAWLVGPDFDTRFPAVSECLNAREMTATKKSRWLEEFLNFVFNQLKC